MSALQSDQTNTPDPIHNPHAGYRSTVIASSCLSIAWLGDSVIYIVLPLYASTFGLDALMVGVLLSCNRVVRILGYGWVAPLTRRFGANVLTAAACVAGAVTTVIYGLPAGFVVLLLARMVWGGAWGILNLTMTAYAYGEGGPDAGKRVGVARAISSIGPCLAVLCVGFLCVEIGPHRTFILYGLLSLVAVPLAFLLPSITAERRESSKRSERRWMPTRLNMLNFAVTTANAALSTTLSLLLASFMSMGAAIIAAGLLVALQRVIQISLAFVSGPLTDRIGARNLLVPCSLGAATGLVLVAANFVYVGAVLVVICQALLQTAGNVLAAERSRDRIAALASYATWTDVGLAAGAFLGASAVATFGFAPTYTVLAVAVAVTTLPYIWNLVRPQAKE